MAVDIVVDDTVEFLGDFGAAQRSRLGAVDEDRRRRLLALGLHPLSQRPHVVFYNLPNSGASALVPILEENCDRLA